jgi:hypothetical protein
MKTLNGYEIVDAQAREDIEVLKQSGGADLTNYYTKDEVDTQIQNALNGIAIAEERSY